MTDTTEMKLKPGLNAPGVPDPWAGYFSGKRQVSGLRLLRPFGVLMALTALFFHWQLELTLGSVCNFVMCHLAGAL